MVEGGGHLILIHLIFILLIFFLPFTPITTNSNRMSTPTTMKKKKKKKNEDTPKPPSSWEQFMNILTCKNTTTSLSSKVDDPLPRSASSNSIKLVSRCNSSICSFRDVVHVNTRVVDHAGSSNSSSDVGSVPHIRNRRKTTAAAAAAVVDKNITRSSARSSGGGMQLRKLSGCYECRAIDAEPASRRYPRPRTLCPCAECGEVFTKPESLELHQALRHAVSELGPDDSGRNIVEIIFKSSWQKKDIPIVKIERILKVHNTQRTVARFEDYRESVKSRAFLPRKNPRCAADGNELLRFYCTSLSCPLGANSSTSLCLSLPSQSNSNSNSNPHCTVCTIIRYGFSRAPSTDARGIGTNASSGRAHDWGPKGDIGGTRRAMLVCRVIAGRVRKGGDPDHDQEELQFDSVAGEGMVGSYGNIEELFVDNPRAILPCFVVIYRAMD